MKIGKSVYKGIAVLVALMLSMDAFSSCGSPPSGAYGSAWWSRYAEWCRSCGGTPDASTQSCRNVGAAPPRVIQQAPPRPTGPTPVQIEQKRVRTVQELEDQAYQAYQRGDYATAAAYYEQALEFDPYNVGLEQNLAVVRRHIREAAERRAAAMRAEQEREKQQAAEREAAAIAARAREVQQTAYELQRAADELPEFIAAAGDGPVPHYLASVSFPLEVASLLPSLAIFHPSPYVRAEAQKALVEATLKKITEASALFLLDQQLRQHRLRPMPSDSAAQKEKKKQEAHRHAMEVAELRVQAFREAEQKADALENSMLMSDTIRITPGPALHELLRMNALGH